MSFNSFGYDGVLQASEKLVNELLAADFYERNLVKKAGVISNDDFYVVPLPIGGTSINVYLLLGKPIVSFTGSDGKNQLSLLVPLYNLAIYSNDGTGVTKQNLNLGSSSLGIVVKSVVLQKTADGLTIDLSSVNEQGIEFHSFAFNEWPDHVGGTAKGDLLLPDVTVDQFLANAGSQLHVADLKKAIAATLKGDLLKKKTIPVEAGNQFSKLSDWDLKTFDSAVDNDSDALDAGASLLLYESMGQGQGVEADATDIISDSTFGSRFSWAAALRSDVLLENLNSSLNRGPFPAQDSNTLNTPGNPFGFLVVPQAGSRSFSLSGGNGNVQVSAAAGGQVIVTIKPGGMTPNGRGTLQVVGVNTNKNFTASGDGSADISIQAGPGDRLTITVYAISTSGDSSLVVWRPKLSFVDGGIRADFHYYKYIDNWCDGEGDGWVIVQLSADRTHPFMVGIGAGESDFDLPWWSYLVAWLGGEILFGLVGSVIIESLLPTVFKDLIKDDIDFPAQVKKLGAVDSLAKAPSLPDAALFLDSVQTDPRGLVLSGFADAGQILSYGRTFALSSSGGKTLEGKSLDTDILPSFYQALDWAPGLGTISIKARGGNARVVVDQAADRFWDSGYDDLRNLGSTTVTADLSSGTSALMIIDNNFMLCKILLERYPNNADVINPSILITWVAYHKRVSQSVRLKNNINSVILSSYESSVLKRTFYAYHGTLNLETAKFFLTSDTELAGQEKWTWNGQPITDQGIDFPGGMIRIIPGEHALAIDIDQNNLQDLTDAIFYHQVEFNGVDVFGRPQSAKINLTLPASIITPKKIGGINPSWRDPFGPYIDPTREINPAFARGATELLEREFADPEFTEIITSIGMALREGKATIRRNEATLLVDMLLQGRRDSY